MERIVVAAKAGAEQPWLGQAAAELAGQSKAVVDVVSADGLDMEAFSTVPRAEAAKPAEAAAKAMAEQIRAEGLEVTAHTLFIGSLAIATLLYILVALVATGALPFDQLNGAEAPLATVLSDGAGIGWGADVISFGALVAITSVVLTLLYGQSRILFAMSRDGLLPRRVSRVNPRTRTPVFIIGVLGIAFAALAAVVPLTEIVELVNIGTLFAFVVVNIGVIILRRTRPDLERGYRVPFVPVFPLIGTALCIYLMTRLPGATWARFGIWMALGFAIYFAYGIRHSRLRRGHVENPESQL